MSNESVVAPDADGANVRAVVYLADSAMGFEGDGPWQTIPIEATLDSDILEQVRQGIYAVGLQFYLAPARPATKE